jgi:hypothetical protein
MMPQFFFPKEGENSSPYLDKIADHRGNFTVFSGVSHPDVNGNHHSGQCFLTGAPGPGQPTFRNSISMDQVVAEKIGVETRFPSLCLSVTNVARYVDSISVSRSGVNIPTMTSPNQLYRNLFTAGAPAEKAATLRRIEAGGSVLDLVLDKANRLQKSAAAGDRDRLDQYFQSVRELELRLERSIAWEDIPKPEVDYPEPKDIADANQVIEKSKQMFDLIRLALQTDSTRVITISLSTFSVVPHVPGVTNETHGLTHHGHEPEKIEQLRKIEEAQMLAFSYLMSSLAEVKERDDSLLDNTQVLYGSCLGSANSHSTRNMPMILAGGGYKHPGLLSFDRDNNEPLANLYVTMMQRMGLEVDRFSSGTKTMTGLG